MARCIILGAAGRDFHDFRTFFREHPDFHVVAFTAEQIPFIDQRTFPAALCGPGYPDGVPIVPESRLEALIAEHDVDFVFLSYSDLAYDEVMHKASRVQAAGASFVLLGPKHTQLSASVPVIAVVAARTGAGKSPLSQAIAARLVQEGLRVGVLRHPMPYGDLLRQQVQRFATPDDLDAAACTIEEREEYRPYVEAGLVVFAGVAYDEVLAAAEAESDVILWDGGNNDVSFVRAGLVITVLDALRPGHETRYYPGETNARMADVVVINKVDVARPEDVAAMRAGVAALNPGAAIAESVLEVHTDLDAIRGRRVVVVEDGPTTTHGGRPWGAGLLAAQRGDVGEIVDPRPFAVGTLAEAYAHYPHIGPVLPALGYSEAQRDELAETLRRAAPDVVLDASPARIGEILDLPMPVVPVRYRFAQRAGDDVLQRAVDFARARPHSR